MIGSGNVVHNLRAVDYRQRGQGYDWAKRFDEAAREMLEAHPPTWRALDAHPDFGRAVPTPDHYLPLLYIAGLADTQPFDLAGRGPRGRDRYRWPPTPSDSTATQPRGGRRSGGRHSRRLPYN